MTDYEDLAFQPKMKYMDLRKYARKLAIKKKLLFCCVQGRFRIGDIIAGKNLTIGYWRNYYELPVRNFEIMKTIIDALYGDLNEV